MDLSIFLSLILSIIAIGISIITLWLTELRGPNISLLNDPEFKTTDESFELDLESYEYTPKWFNLKSVPLIFANYGGKAGTIVDLMLNFVPNSSFKRFFESFYFHMVIYEGDPSTPITIEEGTNQHLKISPQIRTIDWKEEALAEVLNPSLKVEDMVIEALEKSKDNFRSFCNFLEDTKDLGKVTCIITLTTGRFRTKVTSQTLVEEATVKNDYKQTISSLRNCMSKWEQLHDTKVELQNKLTRGIEDLRTELDQNLATLKNPLSEHDVSHKGSAIKLRIDNWCRLQQIRDPKEKRIRWFLVESNEELEKELRQLYRKITEYNDAYDELIALGEFRNKKHFDLINAEREKIQGNIEIVKERLSDLQRRYIS